jgi:hypothetical protein
MAASSVSGYAACIAERAQLSVINKTVTLQQSAEEFAAHETAAEVLQVRGWLKCWTHIQYGPIQIYLSIADIIAVCFTIMNQV